MDGFSDADGQAHSARTDTGFDRRPRRRRKRIALTGRDVKVLELLVTRRVETLDALHRLAFLGRSRKRAVNRLGELVSAGYLDRRSVDLPNSERLQSVYFLTSRGRTALQLRWTESSGWFATRHWKLDLSEPSIPHQIATNRVCEWIGARPVPEHLLPPQEFEPGYSKSRSRPDAVYEAREEHRGRRLVWVEVDLGHYNRRRLEEKVWAFARSEQACFLIIACPTDARADWVADALRPTFGDSWTWQRMAVRSFADLRGVPPDAFPGGRGMRPSLEPPSPWSEI